MTECEDKPTYRARHRWSEASDYWRIRLMISKTNLPHIAKPKHETPENAIIGMVARGRLNARISENRWARESAEKSTPLPYSGMPDFQRPSGGGCYD